MKYLWMLVMVLGAMLNSAFTPAHADGGGFTASRRGVDVSVGFGAFEKEVEENHLGFVVTARLAASDDSEPYATHQGGARVAPIGGKVFPECEMLVFEIHARGKEETLKRMRTAMEQGKPVFSVDAPGCTVKQFPKEVMARIAIQTWDDDKLGGPNQRVITLGAANRSSRTRWRIVPFGVQLLSLVSPFTVEDEQSIAFTLLDVEQDANDKALLYERCSYEESSDLCKRRIRAEIWFENFRESFVREEVASHSTLAGLHDRELSGLGITVNPALTNAQQSIEALKAEIAELRTAMAARPATLPVPPSTPAPTTPAKVMFGVAVSGAVKDDYLVFKWPDESLIPRPCGNGTIWIALSRGEKYEVWYQFSDGKWSWRTEKDGRVVGTIYTLRVEATQVSMELAGQVVWVFPIDGNGNCLWRPSITRPRPDNGKESGR